jgi:solute carrier family 35 protein E1
MFPVWLILDFSKIYAFLYSTHSTSVTSGETIISLFFLNGICHFGQNIAAFTFMTKVTPLTYTVFNTFKRTFVIISAILYFGNSVGFLNSLGIALTTAGVALYNKAKLDMRKV